MKCARLKNALIKGDSSKIGLNDNIALHKGPDSDPYHANLVTSNIVGNYHFPCLDIDIDMEVINSTHNKHLYFKTPFPLTTEQYDKLLSVMLECGIIQKGIYNGFKRDGYTSLRLPGLKKDARDDYPLRADGSGFGSN